MSSQWRLDGAHVDVGNAAPEQAPHISPLRVLIVDASRDAADSLALLLRLWGYPTQVAYSAAEALQMVESFRPDVVLSEIVLPQQDGCVLARRLRQHLHDVLLVAVTSQGQAADRLRSREAGFDVHLVKPAILFDLQNILRQQALVSGLAEEGEPSTCAGRPASSHLLAH